MTITYHVPESECRAITHRPSYSGRPWGVILDSARITADAWGRAYIVVTRTVADSHVGGRIYVSTRPEGDLTLGRPVALLAEVRE